MDDTIATIKKKVQKMLQAVGKWPPGEPRLIEEYIFITAADNFLGDDAVQLYPNVDFLLCLQRII
jgi:hypothetical protein